MDSQGRESRRGARGKLELGLAGKEARPPRVIQAFAVYLGLALILAAAIILYFVRHNVEQTAQQQVKERAVFVASSVVPKMIGAGEWAVPSDDEQLKTSVAQDVLRQGSLAATFIGPDGKVVYTSRPNNDGVAEADVRRALAGENVTNVVDLPEYGDKTIQALVPVSYAGDSTPTGVLVLYHDYAAAAGTVREQMLILGGVIVLIFLLLYAALLPVLRRTTKQLSLNNRELSRRAADLNENLIQRAEIEQRLRETIASLRSSEHALVVSQEETIMRLSMAVESRDQETGAHIERMGRYCALLAEKLGWEEGRRELLRIASPLHDVGKIAIPDAIMLKPGSLSEIERAEMQKHAQIGHDILSGSDSPLLDLAAKIALTHHEHWDGGGYPRGLIGDEIPIEGRMAAIADVFDALTSDRVYRSALSIDDAMEIMAAGRGKHFDPELLDVFFDSMVEILIIRDEATSTNEDKPRRSSGTAGVQPARPAGGQQTPLVR
jgi:HD-GYP domain-containing protein (c-di-GMP phosphodiesterase class II)